MRLRLVTALAVMPLLPCAAAAAPGCNISPLTGLFSPQGAVVTMQVVNANRPCGERLWVQNGVIPFTVLQAIREPQHGSLMVSDPNQFSYTPVTAYTGTDQFEILARGNNKGGGQVTAVLHVTVTVTDH